MAITNKPPSYFYRSLCVHDQEDTNMHVIFPQAYMAIINMATVEIFEVIPDTLT